MVSEMWRVRLPQPALVYVGCMARSTHKSLIREKALQLRIEERKGFEEILRELPVARSTLAIWLKDFPLDPVEKAPRKKRTDTGPKEGTLLVRGEPSRFHLVGTDLTPHQMGHLAESAVLFRLTLHGFRVFRSVVEGDRADFIVLEGDSRPMKVQVKCVKESCRGIGLPTIKLLRVEGFQKPKRYTEEELDFIVGYWLYNDTAYVYSLKELKENVSSVTITQEGAEAWHKLRG